MSVSNRFADILGADFYCLAEEEPPRCPMEMGEQPHLVDETGEYVCPFCLVLVGNQTEEDDSRSVGEDIIDEEEAISLDLNYTPEMVEQREFTSEDKRIVDRKDAITKVISLLISIDRPFIEYMSTNQDAILTMLTELEEAEVDGFGIGGNIRPKIIAVASHMFKRLPNSESLRVLEIKTNDVLSKKIFLDKTYTSEIDNSISIEINDIGNSLEIPNTTISKAIERYEKDLPPNREPKDRVKAAAWLYSYLSKETDAKPKKGDFTSLPGISRVSFGKAVSVYLSYFQQ